MYYEFYISNVSLNKTRFITDLKYLLSVPSNQKETILNSLWKIAESLIKSDIQINENEENIFLKLEDLMKNSDPK